MNRSQGPINIPIITEPGSGNSTTTTSDPFSGLAVPGLVWDRLAPSLIHL
nr:hypothetical protein [Mycobacterium tuberculosis]